MDCLSSFFYVNSTFWTDNVHSKKHQIATRYIIRCFSQAVVISTDATCHFTYNINFMIKVNIIYYNCIRNNLLKTEKQENNIYF